MLTTNALILETAGKHLGLKEWPGAPDNPEIVEMFETVGHGWVQDDETAWCAAFVGSILSQIGLQHTGALNARSYENWGTEVSLQAARPGDIVVFWRETPDSWKGHVAILVRFDGDRVIVRGGNQGNSVTDAPYPLSRIVSIRRASANADIPTGRAVIKFGSRGAFVMDLQDQLKRLNYPVGQLDGIFGKHTRSAVLAFQADHNLTTDGVVGTKTWNALEKASPRALRTVDEATLRKAGSKTIAQADQGEKEAKVAGSAIGTLATVDTGKRLLDEVSKSGDMLKAAQTVLVDNWPVLLILVVGVLIATRGPKIMKGLKNIRVVDAILGNNLAR